MQRRGGDEGPTPRTAPPVTVIDPTTGESMQMTKTAAKKLARRAMREAKKEARKPEFRARERQRRKERRILQREERSKDPDAQEFAQQPRPCVEPFHARVAVDLGFDDMMTQDETTSLASQLGYLYGVNRTSSHPFSQVLFVGAGRTSARSLGFAPPKSGMHVYPDPGTSETSLLHDRVGKHMEDKNRGVWHRWKRVNLLEYGGLEALWDESTTAVAPCAKSNVVYLTADTGNTIDALEEGKTYVIGGIVDRNRYKHLCAKKAEAMGITMARLPIDPSYLGGQHMGARRVLTVNQVFAILVGWTETRDWTAALQRGLPMRKFVAQEGTGEAQ
ncbi:tRNA (guanine(9)-N(1))-methyltransferase [Malassezia vespertilionis]|uniref:tRNA (guanine(9)-N1)-methyltransferase n=1 Tax=Malassezia vespertilionis TaxID=2020962 RepID=A0A2N1J973_9BASI|nr:tRNA (guanine(9)-N(1))-methyltransferase [Malassezia vespertilionis]PKI83100.1 Trm10p [Malassezia vespertilionis]WFD07528.1 tRNA (guanine(9)-N(1))-methyltransferase [Malassezia vespertilionis]